MSRSGYSDDCDSGSLGLWRGAVDRAIGGKRGQAFLRELAAALDVMPVRELIVEDIVREDGACCAIGSVAIARQLDVSGIDQYDGDAVGDAFGIARAMACEIAYVNDDCGASRETPAERWQRVRNWVARELGEPSDGEKGT